MPKAAAGPVSKTPKKTIKRKAAPTAVEKSATAQDRFLDELIKMHTRVSIFLVNGVKLEGEIKSYDRYVIIMSNAVSDKVYKHAISTIMPMTGHAPAVGVVIERRTARRALVPPSPRE